MADEDPPPPEPRDEFDLPVELEREIERAELQPTDERQLRFEELCIENPEYADEIRFLQRMSAGIERELEDQVGPYRIVRTIGEGGMGTVFLAQQQGPLSRPVALKVIKLGMDTRAVLTRFEHERRLLAAMDHDTIARVFDAGTTDRGQPFFAMQFVDGLPLVEFCGEHEQSIEQRLELFCEVCAGVGHAHQRGIIHRDLKPSNILVEMVDGAPRPRIIDFGLARAVERDQDLSEVTLAGHFVGTPDFMSPEQATGEPVDTRTDVYALGVILYELLTGQRPLARPSKDSSWSYSEIRRVICETEPAPPSTRVDSAARRRELRGELDWIVMRALEKEPDRRYRSAAALADDVQRYLRHEPVQARPPSRSYRLRKFVRRNRSAVLAALLVAGALVAATTVSVWFAIGEADQRRTAEHNLERFDYLSYDIKLRTALEQQQRFDPAWPAQAPAIQAWLQGPAAELRDALPELRRALADLRATALPRSEADRSADRASHPDRRRLSALSALVEEMRDADAVRQGRRTFEEVELTEVQQGMIAAQLIEGASLRVGPKRQRAGEAALALTMLRRAQRMGVSDPKRETLLNVHLGWACYQIGLDDEARAAFDRAAEGLSPRHRPGMQRMRAQLESSIAAANGPNRAAFVADLENKRAQLDAQVDEQRTFRFEHSRDGMLHETLLTCVRGIESFVASDMPRNERRLARAEQLAAAEERYRDRWQQAIAAVGRDYGFAGSRFVSNLDLSPQVGLVPIGRNPVTKLWEFYDLLSASDPEQIPTHRADGSLDIDGDSGLVFVLMPPVLDVVIGDQDRRPNEPNYQQQVLHAERAVVATLDPFLMSRYEMTQGQWQRLSRGQEPSRYDADELPSDDAAAWLRRPVEQVSWNDAVELLRRYRLDLPTEAQWEYACRAGSFATWSTGSEPATLAGTANLRDASLSRLEGGAPGVPFDDTFAYPAPVGSLTANLAGLYDMHGNVAEWCRDTYQVARGQLQEFHGLRHSGPGPKVYRGGSFRDDAAGARSSCRRRHEPTVRIPTIGVRPIRPMQ